MNEPALVAELSAEYQLELTESEIGRLSHFLDLLEAAGARMNLTAVRDRSEAWRRHVFDSLTLLPFLESSGAANMIDVGSGGGLPGIPLAICRPALPVTLLEATGKKGTYLVETAQALGLDQVTVLVDRAEVLGSPSGGGRDGWDVVTARAVGPLPVLLELTLPLTRPDGYVLAIKGRRAPDEVKASAEALKVLGGTLETMHRTPSGTIVVIRRTGRVGRQYPRRPGEPARCPIGGPPRARE